MDKRIQMLFETVNVLLEDAACADKIEDAQELIEKAKDINEKALAKLSDAVDKCEGKSSEKSSKDKDDEEEDEEKEAVNEKKAEAITEAVDALLNCAVMAETAEEADGYIKKAEELQKAIDDIPEETPVENKEYPEDTSGGQGCKDDCLEDIKDLLGGDTKAIDLLTKDPNTLTID